MLNEGYDPELIDGLAERVAVCVKPGLDAITETIQGAPFASLAGYRGKNLLRNVRPRARRQRLGWDEADHILCGFPVQAVRAELVSLGVAATVTSSNSQSGKCSESDEEREEEQDSVGYNDCYDYYAFVEEQDSSLFVPQDETFPDWDSDREVGLNMREEDLSLGRKRASPTRAGVPSPRPLASVTHEERKDQHHLLPGTDGGPDDALPGVLPVRAQYRRKRSAATEAAARPIISAGPSAKRVAQWRLAARAEGRTQTERYNC